MTKVRIVNKRMFGKVKIHDRNPSGREATTSRVEKTHVYLHSIVETNMP
jgi:hypothetical protein